MSFTTPQLGKFETVVKKAIYNACVKVSHCRSLEGMKASRWTDYFGPGSSPKGSWLSLYKPPVNKRTGDLQWRIVHGIIATNRHVAHLNTGSGEGCPFCSAGETTEHLFLECARLRGVFRVLQGWKHFIFGPKFSPKEKTLHVLVNVLFGTTKLAIWKTRKKKVQGQLGSLDPVMMLAGLLSARLRVDFAFHKPTDNLATFTSTWGLKQVLCSIQNGTLILNI